MPNIGPMELILILIVLLLVVGPGKLPDVGAALGKTIREFRKASSEVQDAVRLDTPPPATPVTPGPATPAAPPEAGDSGQPVGAGTGPGESPRA